MIVSYRICIDERGLHSQLCLESKASLQLATDKLKEVNVPDHAINEFKGGIARIINETKRAGVHILNKKKLSCETPGNYSHYTFGQDEAPTCIGCY